MSENVQQQINLSEVKPVEGGPSIDLEKFDKKPVKIEGAQVIQVPSKFTPKIGDTEEHQKQWALKVRSIVLETIGEGEDKIEFRASELFNLIQDKEGKLTGYPTGEKANLMKFLKDLKIPEPEKIENLQKVIDIITSKDVLVKAYDKEVEGGKRTYLKFRY